MAAPNCAGPTSLSASPGHCQDHPLDNFEHPGAAWRNTFRLVAAHGTSAAVGRGRKRGTGVARRSRIRRAAAGAGAYAIAEAGTWHSERLSVSCPPADDAPCAHGNRIDEGG